MSLWQTILVFFANLFGKRAGAADQRSADVEKANVADQKITRAEESAPNTNDALISELLDPNKRV